MKNDVVSLIVEKIISIIIERMKGEKGAIIQLTNDPNRCKMPKPYKLKLTVFGNDGRASTQIVSECLSLEDTGRIRESVDRFCKKNNILVR